ncbi:uncharacterized protein LOC113375660 [Ctenocephalides felis]|uniref:uncharacterized protein LOC113375660 n=1 Tax=Ctenocephalides felis TaxID=7515 RepID=UPI000E6E40B3|nr:uncharacterized protein LOC113375660 [Ctenocephalides felis]
MTQKSVQRRNQVSLEKWSNLELMLQKEILERGKTETKYKERTTNMSYANVASRAPNPKVPTQIVQQKTKSEFIYIKPECDKTDRRSNDEIKDHVKTGLKDINKQIKVRGIRQLRNKGVVLEVETKRDIEIIKRANLSAQKLVVEEPKKLQPQVIMYDVEEDCQEENFLDCLILKNFEHLEEAEADLLRKECKVVTKFKTKFGKNNWVIQLPGKHASRLLNEGRVYMDWRTYRLSEYVKIPRCYKCHAYGHIARVCRIEKPVCENCGSSEHTTNDCSKDQDAKCVNCVRNKRKETGHKVTWKLCPEYEKQLQIYKNKISWD